MGVSDVETAAPESVLRSSTDGARELSRVVLAGLLFRYTDSVHLRLFVALGSVSYSWSVRCGGRGTRGYFLRFGSFCLTACLIVVFVGTVCCR